MSRKQLLQDETLDKEKYLLIEEVAQAIQNKIELMFVEEFQKTPKYAQATLTAAIYAPISFSLAVLKLLHANGMDVQKEYPTFIQVYTNYLKVLSQLENDWKNLSFEEFLEKFGEAYKEAGHFTIDTNEK